MANCIKVEEVESSLAFRFTDLGVHLINVFVKDDLDIMFTYVVRALFDDPHVQYKGTRLG